VSAQSEGEVHPPGETEPTAVEREPAPPDPTKPAPPDPPPPPKRHTGTFTIGAGFSTDEGPIAVASIAQDDLFHTGNHLSMHAQLSARRQLFLTRFIDPDVLGSRLSFEADLYNDRHKLPGFTREAAGGTLTLSHPIGEHTRAFVGYRLEDVKATDNAQAMARTIEPLPPLTGGLVSAVRAGVVYTTLDRADAPLRGTQIGGSIEVADPAFGSDLQFTKTDGWIQHHAPIGPLTLHMTGSFSTVAGPGGLFSTIGGPGGAPRSERLFLASSNEIRGYRPDAFGPVDALGTPVGGVAKVLGSVELEVPLVRRIGLSAIGFADTGGLFDRSGQGQVGTSVGVGLLWRSPIGALRFNWAIPLDGSRPGFGFGIGSSF